MLRAGWRGLAAACAVALVAVAAACSKSERKMDNAGEMDEGMSMSMPAQGADYTVVLRSTWTPQRHPFEYPTAGALTGPHFSGVIGATHSPAYSLFAVGSLPTAGLERLSEEGKHTPLDEEIRAAVAAGTAGALFESGPLRDFADSIVFTVHVDAAHPLISFVNMVAPSPDWFTGAANVDLIENGSWVALRTIELPAYDSGGDDGTTYKAPDRDNNPKKPTSQAMTRHFVVNGVTVPVATVTFTRK